MFSPGFLYLLCILVGVLGFDIFSVSLLVLSLVPQH